MFNKQQSNKKVDKPSYTAFSKAIADNIPGKDAANELFYEWAGSYIAGKVIRNAKR